MRKVQPFTISTKLSIASDHNHQDHTPDLHLSTPSVTSEPDSAPSQAPPDPPHTLHDEEEEDEEGELLSPCASSRSVRKIAICRSTEEAAHAGLSPPSPPQVEVKLSEEEEAVMKSTCEHLSQQEVNLALEVSLFYQRADIILSDISRTLSQSENTRQHFYNSKASSRSSEQIDDIAADITVLDRCVHRLSELHPTLTARVRLKQKKVKTCWTLLLQRHSIKQSDPPEALCSQFGDRQEEPGPGPGPGPEPRQWPEPLPRPGPPGCTTLSKPPSSERRTEKEEEEEEEEESPVTIPVRLSPVRCDEHPDHSADVTPLASSISVFLTFDPQTELNQDQEPAESQLTPPPLTLVTRCVQVPGESRETHCCKDSSSGVEPFISSSTTTFLPRVSTVVLPPSPSNCSVSTLNLQPETARMRRGSTHRHRVSGMTGDKDEGEDKEEDKGEDENESKYREREASTHRPNTWPQEGRTSRPPINTELLLYIQNNSVVAMETEDATGQLEIIPGGDDTQVSDDSRKSCCSVAPESTLDLPTYTNDVLNFKSKQDTRSKVQQPPEYSSSSVSPTTILSGLQRPQDQNQQVHLPSSSIRKTSNENSETNKAEDQVKLPGVSSESSSLHPEEEGLALSFVSPTDSEDDFYFRSEEDTSISVSPATILSPSVYFSSSTLRRAFNENVETKDIENSVKPTCVSSESFFALHQEEGGLALSLNLPTDHKDISHFRSKEDSPANILSDLNPTQDQNQRTGVLLSTTRKTFIENSETRDIKDQVILPGVCSESSSSLLRKEEGMILKFDTLTDCKDVSNFRSKEDTISSILSGLHQTQDHNQQADFLNSSISKTFTDNSETKESEDQVRLPGVSSESSSALHQEDGELTLSFDQSQDREDVSHFRSIEDSISSMSPANTLSGVQRPQDQNQQVDLSSSAIREAFIKNSVTKETEDHVKPPDVSSESLYALFPGEEGNVNGDFLTLQPSGSSTIIQEDQGNKNRHILQEGTFIQKTEHDSSGPKLVHHQHHCVSVHIKTCDLRGHIYQPITGHALLSTQRVDERSASMCLSPGLRRSSRVMECLPEGCCICSAGLKSIQETESNQRSGPLSPGLRRPSRVVKCLTEGCCICSAGLRSRKETESNQRPDRLSPDRWLFDEVEDELEDIWRQIAP
ncbi:uncharacterized protein LOC122873328 [Siniperca chuatsi]|uniref:uncharacterized protein LOC122873328 n=1 Tax=Siniperca chuatsi TaxID=119488 RepID=UPI001CE14FBE|nr:uncharacterized protein LOC122873328 [Siniperca chuatsi]